MCFGIGQIARESGQLTQQTVKFSGPPEMEQVLPRPLPAVPRLPDWFKALPGR
jgi:hypothetical protein